VARLAGAASLALLAIGAGPGAPPPPAEAALVWQASGATEAFRLVVPSHALAEFLAMREAALREERASLRRRAEEALSHDFAALESALLRGLPDFADWAYGWVESYVTAYVVLGDVVGRQVAPGPEGRLAPWEDYRRALDALVAERFGEVVVRPAGLDRWAEATGARLGAVLEAGWAASLASEGVAWEGFLAKEARVTGRFAPGTGCAASLPAVALPPATPEAPDHGGLMTLRALRPFVGRGGLIALRLGVGGGSGEVTGLVMTLLQPSFSGLASAVTGVVGLWAGDWIISRLDAALHRGRFEAAVASAIAAHRATAMAASLAAVEEALAAAYASRTRCAGPVTRL
jgi:hypothetical protein